MMKLKNGYKLVFKKKNHTAMYTLACYYRDIEKNEELMEKYFLMADENGSKIAMSNLAKYKEDKLKPKEEPQKKKFNLIPMRALRRR